jgi:hypothetical protein
MEVGALRMLTRARVHPVLAVGVVLVVVLANYAVTSYRRDHEKIDACGLLPASVVQTVLGVATSGEPFEPDGGDRSATGCSFGEGTDESITVFATPDDAGYFGRVRDRRGLHDVAFDEVDGDGYQAYWGGGPRVEGVAASQSLLVLKGGRRANVILYGVTDRSIRPTVLAAVIAAL